MSGIQTRWLAGRRPRSRRVWPIFASYRPVVTAELGAVQPIVRTVENLGNGNRTVELQVERDNVSFVLQVADPEALTAELANAVEWQSAHA